ncbi:MAG: S9 family peptidase [candidate division Zixibacteria bacterium]
MSNKARIISQIFAIAIISLFIAGYIGCGKTEYQPPVAQKIAKKLIYHNDTIIDNYYWLRERDSEDVLNYLRAENTYKDSVMKHTEPFQEQLFEEIKSRMKETDLTVPVKRDSFYYYSRTEEGKQYNIYCRKLYSLEAPEEVILDVNRLAEGYDTYYLGSNSISPDHKLLAYTVDTTGREQYTIYAKILETGEILPDTIHATDGKVVWANDSKTLFYTTLDDIERPYKLFRHVLGIKTKNDVLVYHEKDRAFDLYIHKSSDKKYLLMVLEAIGSTEYRFLRADRPTGKFRIFKSRVADVEYEIDHRDNFFYIRTNEEAQNFKLMKTPDNNISVSNWSVLIEHRDSTLLTGFNLFQDYLVLYEKENALRQIRIINFNDNISHYIEFPESIYTVYGTGNHEFDTDVLRVSYSSMITPKTIFDYNMKSREKTLKKQEEIVGGYDKSEYVTERLYAEANDGIKVPITLVYKKGMIENGPAPLYLYGYGSYGFGREPYFSKTRLTLLNRGIVYATGHIRGGNDMGRWWYEDGKYLKKKNTFSDFIACAEHLISEGYTSPEKLIIGGGSAGGLLIGAVVNMRPGLFKAAIAKVPFVDVINTMMDPTIPLTVNEYTEWGNPNEIEYYDYMKSYSPYDNVSAQAYPNMLITAGLYDPRVQYWEPAKWTAKLRATKTDNNIIILKTNMKSGHGGYSGRYDRIRDIAFEYAYILDILEMN